MFKGSLYSELQVDCKIVETLQVSYFNITLLHELHIEP